jgi:hypothetical protein
MQKLITMIDALVVNNRIKQHQNGERGDSVDILLTGCEVSLWVLEQFASDLHQVVTCPHFKIGHHIFSMMKFLCC